MEKFYQLLREYNLSHQLDKQNEPAWGNIYRSVSPPVYWLEIGKILEQMPRDSFCVEVGCGMGDVLALLLHLGFKQVIGLERDTFLTNIANQKLGALFGRFDCVYNENYPCSIQKKPDVLILVNCVYSEGNEDHASYLRRLSEWHVYNGVPQLFILELIDASFQVKHPSFPNTVRVSEAEIRQTFSGFQVDSFFTYQYPQNTSTKRLYSIRKKITEHTFIK